MWKGESGYCGGFFWFWILVFHMIWTNVCLIMTGVTGFLDIGVYSIKSRVQCFDRRHAMSLSSRGLGSWPWLAFPSELTLRGDTRQVCIIYNQSEYMCCFQLWTSITFGVFASTIALFSSFLWSLLLYLPNMVRLHFEVSCVGVTVTRALTLIPSCHVSLSLVPVVPLQWHRGFSTSPSSRWCSWYLSTVSWRGGGAQSSTKQLTPSLWSKARQEQLTFS